MARFRCLRGIDGARTSPTSCSAFGRELLPRMMLPVGGFEKPAIRKMAADMGLRVADKKDSQEICFVTRDRYDDFIRQRRAADHVASTLPVSS